MRDRKRDNPVPRDETFIQERNRQSSRRNEILPEEMLFLLRDLTVRCPRNSTGKSFSDPLVWNLPRHYMGLLFTDKLSTTNK